MISFHRGMTIAERQKVREEVIKREVQQAYKRAAEAHLTDKCRRAMVLTGERPDEARELHESCKGEEYGSSGCLCTCHDAYGGSVVTGEVLSGATLPPAGSLTARPAERYSSGQRQQ